MRVVSQFISASCPNELHAAVNNDTNKHIPASSYSEISAHTHRHTCALMFYHGIAKTDGNTECCASVGVSTRVTRGRLPGEY